MDENQPTPQAAPLAPGGFPLDCRLLEATLVASQSGKRLTLRHWLRPPTLDEWRRYWSLTSRAMEARPGTGEQRAVNTFDRSAAVEWLWGECVDSVAGYGELPQNWRERIPFAHKRGAIDAITQAAVAEDETSDAAEGDYFALDVRETAVTLEAARNGVKYPRLRHFFASPSSEHEKEFSRRSATTYLVTGGKRGVIREEYPSINDFLVEVYDELCVSVEGYEPNDHKRMDPVHKVIAAGALLGNSMAARGSAASPAKAEN